MFINVAFLTKFNSSYVHFIGHINLALYLKKETKSHYDIFPSYWEAQYWLSFSFRPQNFIENIQTVQEDFWMFKAVLNSYVNLILLKLHCILWRVTVNNVHIYFLEMDTGIRVKIFNILINITLKKRNCKIIIIIIVKTIKTLRCSSECLFNFVDFSLKNQAGVIEEIKLKILEVKIIWMKRRWEFFFYLQSDTCHIDKSWKWPEAYLVISNTISTHTPHFIPSDRTIMIFFNPKL